MFIFSTPPKCEQYDALGESFKITTTTTTKSLFLSFPFAITFAGLHWVKIKYTGTKNSIGVNIQNIFFFLQRPKEQWGIEDEQTTKLWMVQRE